MPRTARGENGLAMYNTVEFRVPKFGVHRLEAYVTAHGVNKDDPVGIGRISIYGESDMFETPKTNRTLIRTVLGITMVILSLAILSSALVPVKGQPGNASAALTAAAGERQAGLLMAGVGGARAFPMQEPSRTVRLRRDPVRVIRDSSPSFSGISVDVDRNEAVAADENLHQILVYDRTANTPPNAALTEPKRILGGDLTQIEFVCGLYVDPPTGDIYATHADTAAKMLVFSRDQEGNVPPARQLNTGYSTRGRGIAVDDGNQELFLTSQHNSAVVVFRKQASGDEPPVRLLQGDRTRLANPHGIAVDKGNDLIYVTNHGHVSSRSAEGADANDLEPNRPLGRDMAVPGSGRFLPPAITVHERSARGDTPPLRVIVGPNTQLNWPSGIGVDERRGELYVANDTGQSILVFSSDADGDVAPIRVLKGPNTNLDSPVGLFLDIKNEELWVANYGNNSLTIFELGAEGDTPPLRMIRSAPAGQRALMIGNPGALAYDTKREAILVPN